MTLLPHYLLFATALLLALNLPLLLRRGLMLLVPLLVVGWILLAVTGFSRIFAVVFGLALWFGGLYSWGDNSAKHGRLESAAAYVYAAGALGVVLSHDFFSLFVYWELMALASTLVIISANTDRAYAAGKRYALLHLCGGVVLLAGISSHIALTQSAQLSEFHWNPQHLAHWLMLGGVLMNAAAPPFSAWLSDAYPQASPTGMVWLSAFTTKTAVYVLLILFAGVPLLLWLGLLMIAYGLIYALFENDLRRLLAYSLVTQVGFMVVGIGIGTELALLAVAAHAFCHILYKALLLMSAGAVLQATGEHALSRLGGLYRQMPLTALCGTWGALAIASVPPTLSFVSKPMLVSAADQAGLSTVWLLLSAAGMAVVMHTWLFAGRVFFALPSAPPRHPLPSHAVPLAMRVAMALLALLCLAPGLWPPLVYGLLPTLPAYQPNSVEHYAAHWLSFGLASLVFWLLIRFVPQRQTPSIDLDHWYRVWLWQLLVWAEQQRHIFTLLLEYTSKILLVSVRRSLYRLHGNRLGISRSHGIGTTALWIGILLGTYLMLT